MWPPSAAQRSAAAAAAAAGACEDGAAAAARTRAVATLSESELDALATAVAVAREAARDRAVASNGMTCLRAPHAAAADAVFSAIERRLPELRAACTAESARILRLPLHTLRRWDGFFKHTVDALFDA